MASWGARTRWQVAQFSRGERIRPANLFLFAGARAIGRGREREKERWIKGVGIGMKEDGDEETEDGERVHERKSETRRADKQA